MKLKILSLFLCACMLFSLVITLNVSAADTHLSLENPATASRGEKITVSIKVNSALTDVGGIRLMLEYDTARLKYIEGSRTLLCKDISESDITPDSDKNGKVYFVWETEKGIPLDTGLVSYQFEVLSAAEDGDAYIYLNLYEMYKADSKYTSIISGSEAAASTVSIGTVDSAVVAVKDKISAIGEVEYTDECKALIDSAFSAYNTLSVVQKNQVSNYDALVEALYTYNELKNSAIKGDKNAQAQDFRTKHKKVLALTVDTVTLSDEQGIIDATADWNAITSADVKGLLIEEKNLLRVLSVRIEELKKIAEDEAAEAVLKAEAKELAKQFREYYAGVLALSEDTITTEERMGVTTALSEIANFEFVNTYVIDELSAEKAHLEKLKARIEQLEAEEGAHPEVAEAEQFNSKFGWLLALTEEDITADDYVNLSVAVSYFEDLSAEAKALIPNGEEKLNTLLAVAEELFYSQTEEGGDPEVIVKTETVEKEIEKEVVKTETVEKEVVKTETVTSTITETVEVPTTVTETVTQTVTETVESAKYITRQLHPMVLWAIIIFAVSITALAVSAIAYFTRKNKISQEETV